MWYNFHMSKQCKVSGCELETSRIISGYCQVHYNRVRRTGSPGAPERRGDNKSRCVLEGCDDIATPSGACRRHWHKVMQPDRAKGKSLKRYGLDSESYSKILSEQGNRCAICPADRPDESGRWSYFAVDHDHSCCSGRDSCGRCVRGLVCGRCNLVLGKVNDDISLLKAMIDYLTRPDENLAF